MCDLEACLFNLDLGATTHVSLSGTVIVRSHRHLLFHTNCSVEYLRGESTMDECQSLFRNYKTCLDVSRLNVSSLRRGLIFSRKP